MFKSTILTAALVSGFLLCANLASAQIARTMNPETLAAREARFIANRLALNVSQKGQLQAQIKQHYLRQDSLNRLSLTPESRTQGLKTLMIQYVNGVKGVLSPAQFLNYKELMEDRKRVFSNELKKEDKAPNEIN
jgi:hypothetical protein